MHREQIAKEMQIKSESNAIRQNAGEFSLINVQWASFTTGASAIFVVAIIALAVLACCWLRAKGQCQSKHRHHSSCPPSLQPSPRVPLQETVPLNLSAPEFIPQSRQNGSGRPLVGQVYQVPTCLPLAQGQSFSCRSLSSHRSPMMGRRWIGEVTPSIRTPDRKPSPIIAVPPSPSRPVSSKLMMKSRSGDPGSGRPLQSVRHPCPVPLPGRGSPLPLLSRSLKGSSTSRPGGLPSMPPSSSPSGRPSERKGLPGCFPEKFRPAHSVSGYNQMGVAGDKPGSVLSMWVVF